MAYAREIFIAIKQKIRFQQAEKEADTAKVWQNSFKID